MKNRTMRTVTSALPLLLLAGCGGGVGLRAPVLQWAPVAVKTFTFSWADVTGETDYRLFEDPDGVSGYTQIATLPADTTGVTLHDVALPLRINARYLLQACDAEKCKDSAPVHVAGSLAAAVGYLKASNTQNGDFFGASLALSGDGNTLAVGASGEDSRSDGVNGDQDDDDFNDTGAVYVFTRSAGTWSQQAYVKGSNPGINDDFGRSLALSDDGNTLAAGAFGEDSNTVGVNGNQGNNSAASSGAVYVFTRSGGTWSQQAYVKASNTETGDWFGVRLALSGGGNTLAVAAPGESSNAIGVEGNQGNNLAAGSGAVYVFLRNGTTWSQQAYVKASNMEAGDNFGAGLALSDDGNTLAVGADGEDSNAIGVDGDQGNNLASGSGAAYVFTRSGGTWTQQAYLKASNPEQYDGFASSVALSGDGDTLALGAWLEDSNATGVNGNHGGNSSAESGAVYVFTRSGGLWGQQAYVKASNTEADDLFGHALALSDDGDTLVAGAIGESSNATGINGNQGSNAAVASGAVYRFTRTGAIWTQQAYVKASNPDANDFFGSVVALTGDGQTFVVAATGEASGDTGVGGNQVNNIAPYSGAAYLY